MLYFFDETLYFSGIGQELHCLNENILKTDFNFKLEYLIKDVDDENRENLEFFSKHYKAFLKQKNKSSKLIIQTNMAKREIEKVFFEFVKNNEIKLERNLGISTFKELFDIDKIRFFEVNNPNNMLLPEDLTPIEEVLTLKVANEEDDIPILFLGNEDAHGNILLNLDLADVQNKNYKKGYLVDVLTFPHLFDVQAAEMKAITHEFSREIQTLKDQLNHWAKISFNNPNSQEAQNFFIKNVLPLIEAKKQTIFEINAAKDLCTRHLSEFTFQLQFGELPIDSIWELYKVYNHITEEQHQNLLKIKDENPTKYTGRWPIAFFKTDNKAAYKEFESPQETPKTRKTLDID